MKHKTRTAMPILLFITKMKNSSKSLNTLNSLLGRINELANTINPKKLAYAEIIHKKQLSISLDELYQRITKNSRSEKANANLKSALNNLLAYPYLISGVIR